MMNKTVIISSIATAGLLFGTVSGGVAAQESHEGIQRVYA